MMGMVDGDGVGIMENNGQETGTTTLCRVQGLWTKPQNLNPKP